MADERVRFLRANETRAEKLLWHQLRRKRVGHLRFRRQYRLERYIVDFVCLPKRLVIEIDGPTHEQTAAGDEARTRWLQAFGYRVMRFSNDDVLRDLEGVVRTIERAVLDRDDPSP